MGSRFGRWPASGRKGCDFNHMHGPMQRQGNDRAGPNIGMGAGHGMAIKPDMAFPHNFLR